MSGSSLNAGFGAISCPIRAAEDAALLLRTGRADMAASVLRGLPGDIRDALEQERAGATSGLAQTHKRAASELRDVQAALDEARSALSVTKAENARLKAERRSLDAELARRRRELADLTAKVTAKRRALAQLREPRPSQTSPPPRPAQILAAALADGRITAERVAELLRIGAADVERIASGKVGLGKPAWQRLLKAIVTARPPSPPAAA